MFLLFKCNLICYYHLKQLSFLFQIIYISNPSFIFFTFYLSRSDFKLFSEKLNSLFHRSHLYSYHTTTHLIAAMKLVNQANQLVQPIYKNENFGSYGRLIHMPLGIWLFKINKINKMNEVLSKMSGDEQQNNSEHDHGQWVHIEAEIAQICYVRQNSEERLVCVL